jgi:hypothetical protein
MAAMGEWRWSSKPGAHETHLLRRYRNPYFLPQRRVVTAGEVDSAKKLDQEDCADCFRRLSDLTRTIEALDYVSIDQIHRLREGCEDVIQSSYGVGGTAVEAASEADNLRNALILDLRDRFKQDNEALKAIDAADTQYRKGSRRFCYPVTAQILRKDSPIFGDEIVPTIVSEDPLSIALILDVLTLDDLRGGARKLLNETRANGYQDEQFEDKLVALGFG